MVSLTNNKTHWNVQELSRSQSLRAGDRIFLSGLVYTARDAAHKRMMQLLAEGKELPFPIKGSILYYAGPTPSPSRPVGACGPTTSSRMDFCTPTLLSLGLSGMIGKGERSREVLEAIQKYHAIYLCAIGGAGALASKHITSCKEIAFQDLGCEAIRELTFQDFPLYVGIDSFGGNLFEREKW